MVPKMKLLFLHTEQADCSEYKVHKAFVNRTSNPVIDAHFLWQSSLQTPDANCPAQTGKPANTRFFDFGRDLSLRRQPQRLHRAWSMGKQWHPANRFVSRSLADIQPHVVYTSQRALEVKRGARLARHHGLPHIVHIHYPVGEWLGKGVIPRIQQADFVIAASEFVRRTAESAGIAKERIQVIYNIVELEKYTLSRDRRWLNQEFGLTEDATVIVVAGRIDPGKGHDLLIEAMPDVLRQFPQAVVLACGENSNGTDFAVKLQQRCAQLDLTRSFRFVGFRHDVARIMAASDIFCLPTLQEAFGLVFTEAMAAGLPVVAVRSGAVPEIVCDGETGLLSAEQDTPQLANNLLTLLQNPHLRRKMGQAGQVRAHTAFAPRLLADAWGNALQAMLMHD